MDTIFQEKNRIIQTKKTVDWLVKNTRVNVFNPITFEGYQRSIDKKHCEKIVSYLQRDFFLPTSIICACKNSYTEEEKLYIVDGQHRVHAFQLLKEQNPERYNEIRDKELSVIVLEKVQEEVEIDTFITINKTSKKVDTSLAYVLKNKINYNRASKDISISKREYLSVELASILNNSEESLMNLWQGGESVFVARHPHDKAMQRALMQYRAPRNRQLVLEALQKAGRMDLVGTEPKCLIGPERHSGRGSAGGFRAGGSAARGRAGVGSGKGGKQAAP